MVEPFLKNLFLVTLTIILCMGVWPYAPAFCEGANLQYSSVVAVIDGDTIEIKGGERVRYLGIDTPEIGQPFYEEAKNKNKELVLGKIVRLEVCKAEPRDKYGRFLAYVYPVRKLSNGVYIDKTLVNRELLISGYARILTIPPCGIEKAEEFRQYQKGAMEKKLGLWGKRSHVLTKDFIPASDAARFVGERKAIYGKVIKAQEGRKATFLEIGNAAKTGLRAVIFHQDKKNFDDDRINPLTHYLGKEIVVYGKIKMYKGSPEVIIGSPSQIEVWQ